QFPALVDKGSHLLPALLDNGADLFRGLAAAGARMLGVLAAVIREVSMPFPAGFWGTEKSNQSAGAQSGKHQCQSVILAFFCHWENFPLVEWSGHAGLSTVPYRSLPSPHTFV